MRHAYLILAHTDFEVLKHLVGLSDDSRVDIYVHFDAKVKDLPEMHVENAGLHILSDRVDVRWADLSMVEAEYRLFEAALENGPYDYYHLLSGVDLPLGNVDAIDSFFSANRGREFIGYSQGDQAEMVEMRARRWHLFPKSFRERDGVCALAKRILRALFLRFQDIFGIRRNEGVGFRKGSQWVSVTEDMAKYFVSQKTAVLKMYDHTFCPDELVMQTLAWNSPFRARLFDSDSDGHGCMRKISWRGSAIDDWREEDYDEIVSSGAMFARKFNGKDKNLIDRICGYCR